MALTERLMDFPAKTGPTTADIVFVGNAADTFNEVKSTIGQIIGAYPALTSIGGLSTASNKMIYTTGSDVYATTDLTAFSRTLLAEASAAAMRATLGVPSTAEAFLVANNLSEGVAATMRTNLGLVIGTNVQAYDATLQSLSALGTAANLIAYTTGVDTWAETSLTAFGRSVIDDADATAGRVTLGVVIGTNVQAYDATLQSLSALGTAADRIAYTTGVDTWAEAPITAFGRSLIDDADSTAGRVTLGLVIGTNVQAYDATLQSIAALGTAADKIAYTTGVDTWAEAALTAFSRTLLDDADAATWRATLDIPSNAEAFLVANDLSEGDPATMRTNLDVPSNAEAFLIANNLSDGIAATMRTNLDVPSNAEALLLTGGTMTGPLILDAAPTVDLEAATKGYVDSLVSNLQSACAYSTTADLAGYTYDNGTLGVGATLTAPGVGALTVDGQTPVLNDRILVQFQAAPEENGVYTLSTLGTGGVAAILTRATDWDQTSEMQPGDIFNVILGDTYSATQWMMSQMTPIVVGTTPITFIQISNTGALLSVNNLSDVANAGTSRTNLGLEIGVDVQAYNANLDALSAATASSVALTDNAGLAVWSGAMTDGQVIMGVTGDTPVKAAITAGTNIGITNGAGSITISTSAAVSTVNDTFMLMGA